MATQTLACNENNDLYLPDGRNLVMLSGSDACAQNLLQRSQERLAENQYNTTEGVDYFGTIFTPQPDYDAARQSLSSNLLACPDVIQINSLTISINGDEFDYEADVHTIYGPLTVTNTPPTT
jgi:hypothetical protein